MSENDFQESLIKGKIAETVFEQMFREGTDFDIYPLGYEYTLPILKHFHDHADYKKHNEVIEKILNNFDNSPDFLLVKPDKSSIYLVEVKFRHNYKEVKINKIANQILIRWDPAWLFLATNDNFYFSPCREIVNNKGQMKLLNDWIDENLQQKYLNLLREFIR